MQILSEHRLLGRADRRKELPADSQQQCAGAGYSQSRRATPHLVRVFRSVSFLEKKIPQCSETCPTVFSLNPALSCLKALVSSNTMFGNNNLAFAGALVLVAFLALAADGAPQQPGYKELGSSVTKTKSCCFFCSPSTTTTTTKARLLRMITNNCQKLRIIVTPPFSTK